MNHLPDDQKPKIDVNEEKIKNINESKVNLICI